MKKTLPIITYLLLLVPSTIGVILISQGVSFARWNHFSSTEHFINFHASLIVAGGIALIILGTFAQGMHRRLEALETKLAGLNQASGK